MSRTLTRTTARNGSPLDGIQHVVLDDMSWELYERLLKEVGDRHLRITYDQGNLEIMSPLPEHEDASRMLCFRVLEIAMASGMPARMLGSTTFRRKLAGRGLEPDECFYLRNVSRVRGKRRITLPNDPPPDLAVKIETTRRSIDRLPIYAALGVPEVWCYDGNRVRCLVLSSSGGYEQTSTSRCFPGLRPSQLARFIKLARRSDHATAAISFRR